MERGLLWLPLLILFVGLAWAGWNEYQKLEAYQAWAADFDRTKYDIYAVLGLKGNQLTWGKPTRQGPVDVQTLSLEKVEQIGVTVQGQPVDMLHPPSSSNHVALALTLQNDVIRNIPFTQIDLAIQWATFLQRQGIS